MLKQRLWFSRERTSGPFAILREDRRVSYDRDLTGLTARAAAMISRISDAHERHCVTYDVEAGDVFFFDCRGSVFDYQGDATIVTCFADASRFNWGRRRCKVVL